MKLTCMSAIFVKLICMSALFFVSSSGCTSIVLQLCPGGALNERIKNQNPSLTFLQRLQIAVAICRALVHLHSIRMIHRDVKTQVLSHTQVASFLTCTYGKSLICLTKQHYTACF